MSTVDPSNMHTDAGTVHPANMHTDAGTPQPSNMHTDAGTVIPFNMHTDMVIGGGTNGTLHLSAKNATGAAMSVTITHGMATRLASALRLSGPPVANPHAPAPVSPFNMHTDAQTEVDANAGATQARLNGPADGPNGRVRLQLTINGPALATIKGSHAGI